MSEVIFEHAVVVNDEAAPRVLSASVGAGRWAQLRVPATVHSMRALRGDGLVAEGIVRGGWYRGDCHVHTHLSRGGELTPMQVRMEAYGLDFVAVTEHNRVEAAWGEVDDPELTYLNDVLVIAGQEVVTSGGHWLAVGLPDGVLVDPEQGIRDGLDRVHAAGGICIAAHPYAPYPGGTFPYDYEGFDAVEVWNGRWTGPDPWQADNEAALRRWRELLHSGGWRPAVANSDAHLVGQLRRPHTVVRAESLTPEAVLAGLRGGHCWLAESASVDLMATAETGDGRSATFGERLVTGAEPVRLEVAVLGVPAGVVTLHTSAGPVHRESLSHSGSGVLHRSTTAAESAFIRVEVRHPDGRMAALSNPIFLADR